MEKFKGMTIVSDDIVCINLEKMFPNDKKYGGYYDFEKASRWSTREIKNIIWLAVGCNQPVPGCLSLRSLRKVLVSRGETPYGYHNT